MYLSSAFDTEREKEEIRFLSASSDQRNEKKRNTPSQFIENQMFHCPH